MRRQTYPFSSDFDRLVAELRLVDDIESLSPAQAVAFAGELAESAPDVLLKALAGAAANLSVDQHRAVEGAADRVRAKKKRKPDTEIGDPEDDTDIAAAATEGQRRSDIDAARRDGTLAKAIRGTPSPKFAPPDWDAEIAALHAGAARIASVHGDNVRMRAREKARAVLAKALTALHQGRLTGIEASTIEARVHRIMNAAGGVEGKQ